MLFNDVLDDLCSSKRARTAQLRSHAELKEAILLTLASLTRKEADRRFQGGHYKIMSRYSDLPDSIRAKYDAKAFYAANAALRKLGVVISAGKKRYDSGVFVSLVKLNLSIPSIERFIFTEDEIAERQRIRGDFFEKVDENRRRALELKRERKMDVIKRKEWENLFFPGVSESVYGASHLKIISIFTEELLNTENARRIEREFKESLQREMLQEVDIANEASISLTNQGEKP